MKSERASSAEVAGALAQLVYPLPHGSVPLHVPDHELLRCIGRGSYGEVWLARNVLGEFRAVKIIQRRAGGDNRPFDREFEGIQRYEPISRSHESQVQILHVGRNDDAGYFYYVMELADAAEPRVPSSEFRVSSSTAASAGPQPGTRNSEHETYSPRTLRAELERNTRLPIAQCLEIGLALTTTLEHLHGRGLVHRDIKPSNIIFVRGRPKLADIGLVTDAGDAASIVGTEGYLAPEGPGSPQADLYSLGKVLYEISTGRDRHHFPDLPLDLAPQRGRIYEPRSSRREEAHTSKSEIRNPKSEIDQSLLTSAATGLLELNEILLKACARDVRQRYQTARQMHDDLVLLERGQSVRRQRARQRRWVLARSMTLMLAAFIAISSGGWFLFTTASLRLAGPRHRQLTSAQRERVNQLYQTARSFADKQTKSGFSHAVDLFNQAIAIDSDYVPAYLGLADAYRSVSGWHLPPREVIPPARSALLRALELDPKSAEAHAQLGNIKKEYDWDWVGAEHEYQRAIALDPGNPLPHAAYATFLFWMGRMTEARAELAKAEQQRQHMPRSHRFGYDIGLLFFFERDYDRAIEQARKELALATNSVLNHSLLMDSYLKKQRYEDALAVGQTLRSLDESPYIISELGHIHARMGHTNEARHYLANLDRDSGTRFVSAYFRGYIYLGLGEKDRALDCLDRAYEERFGWLGNLKVDPLWDDLRPEPRFKELLKKLGLEK